MPTPKVDFITTLPSTHWQNTWPRTLVILGSTGSIGVSALDVIARQPELFSIIALAGAKNIHLLAKQAAQLRPPYLGVLDATSIPTLQKLLPSNYKPTIVHGQHGYEELATLPEVTTVLSAQVGAAGLRGTYAATKAGKVIALANKESLVLAGQLIRTTAQTTGAVILPVDSEHNALFQCLLKENINDVSRLILTASGGPFSSCTASELAKVTLEQALRHPNWNMGPKITIDSATLMNKGLELIEACHLFGVQAEHIDIVIHKESIVHSLVEYVDGSQLAQLGTPDMRVAIAYALGYPKRLQTGVNTLHLPNIGSLSFAEPDENIFACLRLARQAWEAKNGAPIVLNAANEVAVAAFLEKKIHFTQIAKLVENTLLSFANNTNSTEPANLEEILHIDALARKELSGYL